MMWVTLEFDADGMIGLKKEIKITKTSYNIVPFVNPRNIRSMVSSAGRQRITTT